jgi:hypothetical protein
MYGPARQACRRNVEWHKWGRDRRSGVKTAEEKLMPDSLPMEHLGADSFRRGVVCEVLEDFNFTNFKQVNSVSTIPEPGGACGAHI